MEIFFQLGVFFCFRIFQIAFFIFFLYNGVSVSGCSAVGSAPALGQNAERCQWQIKRGVLWAAVEKIEDQRKPDDFFGYRNPGDQSNPSVIFQPIL